MKANSPRFVYYVLVSCLTLWSCTKPYEPAPTPIEQTSLLLTGSVGNTNIWKLKDILVDNVSQPISVSVATFNKTYKRDGTFIDSDGNIGKWNMVQTDSLFEKVTNSPAAAAAFAVQGYHISELNCSELKLEYFVNAHKISTVYKSVP